MHILTEANTLDILLRLAIAMLFGMAIGAERILAHKSAGMRTYALVSMGAALFVTVSHLATQFYQNIGGYNPSQIPAAVITGVGFLGTGLMVWRDQTLAGLTTATGLWISAGIGLAVGFGFYMLGLIATLLTLFIFIVIWFVEQGLKKHLPAIEGAAEQTSKISETPRH
jgi:putative Mg2+ transporter-C (MgtC) family protein